MTLLLLGALPAVAVSTDTFKAATFADFDKGEPDGTLVSSEGEITAGYGARSLKGVEWPMIWSRARAADGTVYFGTGDPGQVVAVRGDEVRVVADLKVVLVTALAIGPGGRLLAGTMPGARLLSIDPASGKWRELARLPTEHLWALHHDAQARVIYAASGSPGKVFAIPERGGKPTEHYDPGEGHLLCMVPDRRGGLLVGSAEKAILYRVTAKGKASAVHDFDANELRNAVVTATGAIYVTANKFAVKTSGMPRYDVKKAGEAGTTLPAPKTKAKQLKYRESELRPGAKAGKGALYRIDREGRVDLLLTLDKGYFTDLALDDSGTVWAAEGSEGKVYLVRRDRTVQTAFDLAERQVLALAVGREPRYLATGDAGAIYHITERAETPAYVTQVFDAKFPANWGSMVYQATGQLRWLSRSGNTAKPDKTWSDWQPAVAKGGQERVQLVSPMARYLQVKAEWKDRQAVLRSLVIYHRPLNQRAQVTEVSFQRKQNKDKSRTNIIEVSWKVDNPDKDDLIYRLYQREELGLEWQEINSAEPITKTKHEWDTESVPDGHYRVKVVASDELKNGPETTLEGHRISAPVLVDNRKPEIVGLTVRYPWASGMARDAFSTVQEIAFSIDGGPWRVIDAGDGIYDSPAERFRIRLPRDLSRGAHVLAVRARDAAENVGVVQVRFVRR